MKITKKLMKEAPEFVICVDPKSGSDYSYNWKEMEMQHSMGVELYFKTMSASSVLDAMREADTYWDDNVYIITIGQKSYADDECIVYKDILSCRNEWNWHIADEQHMETPWELRYNPEYKYFV